MKVFVAKLNINENIFEEEFDSIVNQVIPSQLLKFENHNNKCLFLDKDTKATWTFSDITQSTLNDRKSIVGYLSRFIDLEYEKVINQKRTKEYLENEQTISAPFVYDIDKEIIIFGKTNKITEITFIRVFNNLLMMNDGYKNIGNLKIFLIPSEHNYEQFISIIKSEPITTLEIDIIYPNSKRTFDRLTKSMEDLESNKAKQIFEGDNGLKLLDKNGNPLPPLKEGLDMSEKGYGHTKATYKKEGITKHVSTQTNPMSFLIPFKIDENLTDFVDKIKGILHNIIKKR